MEFFLLFAYRSLSGAQNGLGYARNRLICLATLAMIMINHVMIFYNVMAGLPIGIIIASSIFSIISMIAAIMVEISFRKKGKIYDIHFWETLTTGAITLAAIAAGGNILLIVASVYPGLIVHKGLINLGGGRRWWDQSTEDPTGKTFSIPLLGIKIRRSGNKARIILALVSLVTAVAVLIIGLNLKLYGV